MLLPPKLTHGDNLANLFEKFNAIIDYLRESRLVAGNGIRINRMTAGTTIESTATTTGGVSALASDYSGDFALSLDENGKIQCGEGYINRNGLYVYFSGTSTGIDPAVGYICVYSMISGDTWTNPDIVITSNLSAGYYPVGYCHINNGEATIQQYPVTVALIMVTGPCPHEVE